MISVQNRDRISNLSWKSRLLPALALAAGALLAGGTAAEAHDPRYPQFDDFFNNLYFPNRFDGGRMSSCCTRRDCRVLRFGNENDNGVEAWYDSKLHAYGFIADPRIFDGGTGDTYYVPERETKGIVERQKNGSFLDARNPTDNMAFVCWTPPGKTWCLLPPDSMY
ncbi:MAG: hypothetical protein JOY63_03150 [Acetobacteraceae bacterium]|nr:hypothetical protein [Acetobacteraceae bacterium]